MTYEQAMEELAEMLPQAEEDPRLVAIRGEVARLYQVVCDNETDAQREAILLALRRWP